MIQAVQTIERAIKDRRDQDVPLVNYWLYLFLLSWVTFGIYLIYLYFKRIGRIDNFILRKRKYYEGLIDFTEKKATDAGKYDEVRNDLVDMTDFYKAEMLDGITPINIGLSLFLSIITGGIWGIVVMYKMNNRWNLLQKFEQEFDDKLSQVWIKLGMIKYPLSFDLDSSKKRSFILYVILSIVTGGIWGIVWDYKIHTDPDNMYREFHSIEDTVLATVRQ